MMVANFKTLEINWAGFCNSGDNQPLNLIIKISHIKCQYWSEK
jgi:hypothetical protein